MINIPILLDRLCYRYPSLLVDAIAEHDAGRRLVAVKNVTVNEEFFQGHFPGKPIMPGVLIIEAMAQVGGILLLREVPDREKKLVYFMGIDEARFRKPVVPGDQIRFELEVLKRKASTCKLQGKAFVDGTLAAEAVILSAMVDR